MKGLVVYDTHYGNTKKVAEAIVEQIRADGHEAELRSVREKYESPAQGDFLFVGSPNRMSKVSGKTKRFVKKLDRETWKGKPIAVFVTVGPMPPEPMTEKQKADVQKWILNAGPKLRDFAKARGLNVVDKTFNAAVTANEGPLAEGAIAQVKQFVHEFLQIAKK